MTFMTPLQAQKAGLREHKVVVTIYTHPEVSCADVVQHVQESVRSWGGCCHPDDWRFGLSDRDVRSTRYRKPSS
ncbi:hypothetical protein CPT_Seuss82 [Caulobacter phage Seuss]|uniref:Uncharacterized protein n=1 Tax=Caulobacter phage Seuss TaxID=1675601 RepID=A0A0K1LN18_9CAUD|nr:hypothetical protein HOR08_gp082 [Caulobacter phage Seuss]AKU43608.1 hypothetical protein CPT_Seuss82 [Caulobacter phage Seuss]